MKSLVISKNGGKRMNPEQLEARRTEIRDYVILVLLLLCSAAFAAWTQQKKADSEEKYSQAVRRVV